MAETWREDPIFEELRDAYISGQLIIFAGPGIAVAAGLPNWEQLIEAVITRVRQRQADSATLAEIIDFAQREHYIDALSAAKHYLGEVALFDLLEHHWDDRDVAVPDLAQAIAALASGLRGVLTTNINRLLERAFAGGWPSVTRATADIAQRDKYILKLHGTLPDRSTWVVTRDHYDRAMYADARYTQAFSALFQAYPILFVGYGLADEDFAAIRKRVRVLAGAQPPRHFALTAVGDVKPFFRRTLQRAGIRLLVYENPPGPNCQAAAILRALAAGEPNDNTQPSAGGKSPASSPDRPATPDYSAALDRYAGWARKCFGLVDMAGLGGGHLRLELQDIFVPLRLQPRGPGNDERRPVHLPGNGEDRAVTLANAFTQAAPSPHVFILGEPGSGKTTALKKLLWLTLTKDAGFDGTAIGLSRPTVPIFVRLRDLTATHRRNPLQDFLNAHLTAIEEIRVPDDFGHWLWQQGHLLLLFDGLDEIVDPDTRSRVCDYIEDQLGAAPNAADDPNTNIRGVISCRFSGLGGNVGLSEKFARLDIRPLNDQQIADLTARWFTAAECAMAQVNRDSLDAALARGHKRGLELAQRLRSPELASRRIKELVSNPLLLTLLCVVVFDGRQIPHRRVEFFYDCLRTLLGRWTRGFDEEPREPLLDLQDALRLLRPVAWLLHTSERKYDLSRAELQQIMTAEFTQVQIEQNRHLTFGALIDWLCRETGVLTEYAPDEFGFMHLSLQEYLAATYAAREQEEGLQQLTSRFAEPWWREVILLFVALSEYRLFRPLLKRIIQQNRLVHHERLVRACLEEAYAPDITPFAEIIESPLETAARKAAALRLVLYRADERVRNAAIKLAVKTRKDTELHELAERVESACISAPRREADAACQKGRFDLLLSYHTRDRSCAQRLYEALTAAGARPALPKRPLFRRRQFQATLTTMIEESQTVTALVGASGLGPWDEPEMRIGLFEALHRGIPVLVALLPGVRQIPELPRFLSDCCWVDLRRGIERNQLAALLQALTPEAHGSAATRLAERPFVEPTTGIHFLWIPGGRFMMGANDLDEANEPRHRVEIARFWLAETPVTNRQYEYFVRATGHSEPWYWRDRRFNQPEQPVVGVSWLDANAFCRWLSPLAGRHIALPTEAQWEFAARGADSRSYPWGPDKPDKTRAYFGRVWDDAPLPVGSLPLGRGPFGHLDLAGNVWEWCQDTWDLEAYKQRKQLVHDPVVSHAADEDPTAIRTCRGGSFGSVARCLRSAYRFRRGAGSRSFYLGFRVAAIPEIHCQTHAAPLQEAQAT